MSQMIQGGDNRPPFIKKLSDFIYYYFFNHKAIFVKALVEKFFELESGFLMQKDSSPCQILFRQEKAMIFSDL